MVKLEQKHISYIEQLLAEGKSIQDLTELINFVINLQNEQLKTRYKLVSAKKIAYYLAKRDEKYIHFEIPKKMGGVRKISSPDLFLKKIQRRVALIIEALYTPKSSVNGFVRDRSIVTNAQNHVGKKYVYNIDLKNFFPTIHYSRVKAVLQIEPFNTSPELAHLIAHLSCYKGILPQGSPSSPILTNIVCQSLDYYLIKLARDYHCYYSRYVDDITFSANKNVFTTDEFQKELKVLIKKEGFELNQKKTRLQKQSQRQEVTGIIVNEKLNLKRDYIKKIRAMLNNWDKKGLVHCQSKFLEHYPKEKGFIPNKTIPAFESVLQGKILFLGMVRGKEDKYFKLFITKFQQLNNR